MNRKYKTGVTLRFFVTPLPLQRGICICSLLLKRRPARTERVRSGGAREDLKNIVQARRELPSNVPPERIFSPLSVQ